jgi:hypothetical protein
LISRGVLCTREWNLSRRTDPVLRISLLSPRAIGIQYRIMACSSRRVFSEK